MNKEVKDYLDDKAKTNGGKILGQVIICIGKNSKNNHFIKYF